MLIERPVKCIDARIRDAAMTVVHHFHHHQKQQPILTVHITFMLILNECVATRFGRVRVVDDKDFFNWSVALELTTQLRLGRIVVLRGTKIQLHWVSLEKDHFLHTLKKSHLYA